MTATESATPRPRIDSIDWLRGLVMVVLIHAPLWGVALFGGAQVLLHGLLDPIRWEWPTNT